MNIYNCKAEKLVEALLLCGVNYTFYNMRLQVENDSIT